jgi:hypothetical protein
VLNQNSFGVTGGLATVNVTTGATCSWTASSQSAWITIVGSGQGTGSRNVTLQIAANTSINVRTGTVIVAGRTFTIQQAGVLQSCSYSIAPPGASMTSAGGSQSVTVTTTNGCSWTAVSNASWITIASGENGSGSGSVQVVAASNGSTSSRSGTATIAGITFSVQQDGSAPSCSYGISPTEASVPVTGDVVHVHVSTTSSCTWTATSHASWILVTGGASGTGSGTVDLTVPLTIGLSSRTGTVTIAGETFTVTQNGLLFISSE